MTAYVRKVYDSVKNITRCLLNGFVAGQYRKLLIYYKCTSLLSEITVKWSLLYAYIYNLPVQDYSANIDSSLNLLAL